MSADVYFTIKNPATGEFKDRGSKFFAFAYPVSSESEIELFLNELKSIHSKARHHCYAYRLGTDKNNFRANDDGEPSGTAGKPILGQIDKLDLSDTLVVVVRYFGGTKLGTSGLINAYKTSSEEALNSSELLEKTIDDILALDFPYPDQGRIMHLIKEFAGRVQSKSFTDRVQLEVAIRQSASDEFQSALENFTSLKFELLKTTV